MSTPLFIQIKGEDNVAIAVEDIAAGTQVMPGVTTREDIPQAHKLALTDIPKGGEIIRYGVVLGYAKDSIPVGAWINEHMLELPQSPGLEDMPYGTNLVPPEKLPDPPRTTWLGYRNAHGPAGTRNLLGIVTTVQCAAGVVNVAAERIRKELLPKYPNVDGVVVANHPYGCGVAIKAREAHIPIRAVTNLIRHPNFGGELMVVGLGCEKLTYDMVLPPEDITLENTLTLQDYAGHDAMMDALMAMAEKKLQRLNLRHREELPLSELLIGMQCGGSDAFSGLTANPSAGYAADMLVTEKAVAQPEVDAVTLGVCQLGVAGVLMLLVSVLVEQPRLPQSPKIWGAAVFLGLFCSGIAFVIQSVAQKYTTASHVGVIFTLEPVFSGIVAFTVAGETLLPRGYVGAALMLLSLLVMEVDWSGLVWKKQTE